MFRPIRPILCTLVSITLTLVAAAIPAAHASDCSVTSVGLIPLNDLGSGLYGGSPGGLYPGGANARPAGHEADGLVQAAEVLPRTAFGAPDPVHGKIVLLTIGMSNTSQESVAFVGLCQQDPELNPILVVVNGAQGGQTASTIANPNANFWSVIDSRLAAQGLTPAQVQAVWYKEANANPTQPFPVHADSLRVQSARIMRIIRSRYPNTRLCYCSSRIYAGYASTSLNPEPYAYESGFAMKWLVEDQIDGDPGLNFDPSAGPAVAPWLSWGPYLWADGLVPRSDGLTWACADFQADGTHPSTLGTAKVAAMLLTFFKADATTRNWFAPAAAAVGDLPAGLAGCLLQVRPNPFHPPATIPLEVATSRLFEVAVFDPSGRMVRRLLAAQLQPGRHSLIWDGTDEKGRAVAAGTHFVRLQSEGQVLGNVKATVIR